jgi:hypothetical protein
MIQRSAKAKETTLKSLQSYVEGDIDLETFKQKVGVKESKNKKKGGRK